MLRTSVTVCALALCTAGVAREARAQSGANVLVVANEAAANSVPLAEYYAATRSIPIDQVLHIRTATADEIDHPQYDREIQQPIANWLLSHAAQDHILFIVLMNGVPLRISGTIGREGTVASVDSELTLLYRRMTGVVIPSKGRIPNPYFLGDAPVSTARPFTHSNFDVYLVTRLGGFTPDEVRQLIERGAAPVNQGRILLDERFVLADTRNDWLAEAATRLKQAGLGERVVLDTTSQLLDKESQVLGYYSWGSNDPALSRRVPDLQFVPGALASWYVSTDARTFTEPPAAWTPGFADGRDRSYAGSSQSLSADLVRQGATGVAGQVSEPYLDGIVRPDILFPAYAAGHNLAESFYLAIPGLSWQTVVVGDPLCAPFGRPQIPSDELDPPIDPETEMPARFAARRLAAVAGNGNPAAVKLALRAESRMARKDEAGARAALEQAVSLDETLTSALRTLALIYEQQSEYDKANQAYRRLLARDPNDVVALNNLAYSLAVRKKQPRAALEFSDRALLLARNAPTIQDTAGWIKHLLGDDAEAVRLLEAAAKALPRNAEVRLHAAAAFAAVGRLKDAAASL